MQQAQPVQPQVPMHLRLGPKTLPIEPEKPQVPPKKQRWQSGLRAERRQNRQQNFQDQNWKFNKRPHWNQSDENQSDYHNREEDNNQ